MKTSNRHLVQLQKALIPVSKLVIKFGLQCQEFKTKIQQAYIKAAEELLREDGIKITHQAIAVKTGIDRRVIAELSNEDEPRQEALNKMDMVIMALQKSKSQHDTLTHSAITNLIDGIYGNHIRARAVITELLANNIIQKQDNQYLITESLNEHLIQQAALADEVDITTKRLFQTFYKKMFAAEQAEHLNQASIYSSKIPHSKHPEVNQMIEKRMQAFQLEMISLISEYETNVPEGTYANVGFAQFQFDSNH
ncbi:hypothetical protein ACFODZ_16220 [Marinicella sediminis]|uniref:DUF4423 domain-containing protein n=1 Tax=Marinicella sediminis TaxID=1792834 RepID=A0ABV7JFC0_9GAMM|nr:hypothetical protein [Marinicella sediminis]